MTQGAWSIGAVAQKLRVTRRRIRWLEESGRVMPIARTTSGERLFSPATIRELRRALRR